MVFKSLLIVVFSACVCYGTLSDVFLDEEWEDFKRVHGKVYSQLEEPERKLIWRQNLDFINKHNIEADLGHHSYRLGMNKYGDMVRCIFVFDSFYIQKYILWDLLTLNSSMKCSFITYKMPQSFVFNLNEASCNLESHGCQGGLPEKAFKYIKDNGGIDTEESYPYVGKDEFKCKYRPSGVGAKCTGMVHIPSGDELKLQKAVASVGPISVAIDASVKTFHLYKEGVYNEKRCRTRNLDHAVLVVGYGVYQGQDYWLVKNSWSKSWGMDGYIMMSRNKDNQCGIASEALYPTV
ncbi:cathepsin K-like [Saccostrea cucullata]|uniref:cathepsin K-like n=1 Tax=Saccostrea cuccullata TaxID=36930 RepID=UPI002ED533AB